MKKLIKKGFDKNDIVSFGNMFLLGNGRFGYRGTLEEYRSSEMVNFTVLGFYDQYKDKWREPVNLPNPFYVNVNNSSILNNECINHQICLDIKNGIFERNTSYKDCKISSTRFVSNFNKNLLFERVKILSKAGKQIKFGVDKVISEINGPHYKVAEYKNIDNKIFFKGITNEGKTISYVATYKVKGATIKFLEDKEFCFFEILDGKDVVIDISCEVFKNNEPKDFGDFDFDAELLNHKKAFAKHWLVSRVLLNGNNEAQFELDYSIYHLIILEDEDSLMSIPARGLSGETYKGAIFWDTEIFILPFLILTNPTMAKNTLLYRINTLKGAMEKAKKYGFCGAFYAWESQDDGLEKCSEYNVTDAITGEPIRTYFNEKQIHISGDIVLAMKRYIDMTGDVEILKQGGYEVIYQVAKFFLSYASKGKDNLYHLNDVIGPDEYHECIDDNAFTNYVAYDSVEIAINYFNEYASYLEKIDVSKDDLVKFKNNLYLPKPNNENVIEQFKGYFDLEDAKPVEVKARVKAANEYLGGKTGVAYPTKTIKQADVVTLLVLSPTHFDENISKANFDYYLPYTEHGSSLSSSMYSILGSIVGRNDIAYEFFRKSSSIDLGTNQKMYAGGIYIGGTHPASNAGAYLSVMFGFAGLSFDNDNIACKPSFPKEVNTIKAKIYYKDKLYSLCVKKNKYSLKEIHL